MTERRRLASASPFEEQIGFCRAMRVGNRILVSGTAPIEDDGSSTPGDAGAQADRCFTLILRSIEELGGSVEDVVRVRMFVTDIAVADAVSASHARHMKPARPTATLVAVKELYRPEWLVEIEAEAMLD
ncbi:RidA family protein [Parerythrobacter aestuarii]|uniref:RidA family protein n=1 Tax=Parerythrobacter aestuarii TaxID=3020909 RepID=UPI0024DE10B1|nr:RidA family protein [Parerythrobacter aestuarii]